MITIKIERPAQTETSAKNSGLEHEEKLKNNLLIWESGYTILKFHHHG